MRSRIVAGMVVLLVILSTLIGAATDLSVKHYLMHRLDAQLTQTGDRLERSPSPDQGAVQSPPSGTGRTFSCSSAQDTGFGAFGGQGLGSINVRLCSDGTVVGRVFQLVDDTPASARLSSGVAAELLAVPADGRPHTVSVSGYGAYRVVSRPGSVGPDGGTGTGDQVKQLVFGVPLKDVNDTVLNLTLIITVVSLIGIVFAALFVAVIVRLALTPLRRVTATASKVAEMQLDEGEVALAVRVPDTNPHTEVGQVGVALNRMLENVSDALNARHQSELRVRQFVADASHELRTPLASIRGYAELTRRSRQDAPADIAHAMTRVESEAARMTTLVEDLLLLARLDAGRPLAAEQVDLTRLVVDVLSDAHAAGPDHHWHLDLGDIDLDDEPVSVRGDEPRLQQVLVNMLANARTHTPAGTNVWLSLAQQGDSVQITVRDDGPGIPPELVPDIFERFSRGEESRSRAAGSTGLGLAIVAAVVAAHGGTITVSSRPGDTVFTVTLPTHGPRQDGPQNAARFGGQILSV